MVKWFIRHGADVNEVTEQDGTLLHSVDSWRTIQHYEITALLLEHGEYSRTCPAWLRSLPCHALVIMDTVPIS